MEPKVIYIQKCEEGEFDTWCEEKINDDDTAYVPESSMLALQEEIKRYYELLIDLKKSFEKPENRGTHSVRQMCKYLDAWHKAIESALNGGK